MTPLEPFRLAVHPAGHREVFAYSIAKSLEILAEPHDALRNGRGRGLQGCVIGERPGHAFELSGSEQLGGEIQAEERQPCSFWNRVDEIVATMRRRVHPCREKSDRRVIEVPHG